MESPENIKPPYPFLFDSFAPSLVSSLSLLFSFSSFLFFFSSKLEGRGGKLEDWFDQGAVL